jgi:hypothetical protein
VVSQATEAEFRESRLRNLRRHAIETGILERLYDVEWGVTEALVAEGLSAEVASREGGIDGGALETIRAQFDALTFLAESISVQGQWLATATGPLRLLRRARQLRRGTGIPVPGDRALAEIASATQPASPVELGPDETDRESMATTTPRDASFPEVRFAART